MTVDIGHHEGSMADQTPEQSRRRPRAPRMFETRSQAWREAGLLRQISPKAVRRARFEALLLLPLFVGIVVLYDHAKQLLGERLYGEIEVPLQIVAVAALMIIGWVVARAFGRAFGPMLFRRLEPATAGTVGFLIRLAFVATTFLIALNVAGVNGKTLALTGAFTAVIVGLAAQQTLGNVIAGTMLLSTRPYRVGDRVRLQGGSLGGPVDGIVSSLGLFYTTFVADGDSVMIPNSLVMNALIILGEEEGGSQVANGGAAATGGHRLPEAPKPTSGAEKPAPAARPPS